MKFKTCKPSVDHINSQGVSNNCQIRSLLSQFLTHIFLSKQNWEFKCHWAFPIHLIYNQQNYVTGWVYVLSISTCLQYPSALILSCFSIAFFAGETDNFLKVLQNCIRISITDTVVVNT